MSKEVLEVKKLGIDQLAIEKAQRAVNEIKKIIPYLDELAGISQEARENVERQITEYALSIKTSKLNPENMESFFKKPYYLHPIHGKPDSWELIIPKFIDIQIGWLQSTTDSYNIFLINRYMDWLGEIPEALKKPLGWKPPPDLILEGEELVGSPKAMEEAWKKYRPFLASRDEKRIVINQKRAFELLATMLKDGIKPFSPKPIDYADLVQRRCDFELREYQTEAWNLLRKYSNIGVFYPASTGKTVIGLYVMTHLKPPHLVVVPTRILQEQWQERIEAHTDLQPNDFAVMTYQTAIKRATTQTWTSMIVDETHHLPANQFSKLSFIKRKYTIGLSATPQREDGREEYIFALTGQPIGLPWDSFKKLGIIKSPTSHVWIVKDMTAKFKQLDVLLKEEKKTIIFSDSIELGKNIAGRFKIPHIYGETKARLETIKEAPISVVSRVGDEGVSLPDIERVIEFSWLFGSRRQQLQRFTRLLHGTEQKTEGEHHIIMSLDEYLRDRKRLFSIMDKGFKIVLHREGVSEKVIEREAAEPRPRIQRTIEKPAMPIVPQQPLPSALTQRLPGITRTLERLTTTERAVATTILSNPMNTYSAKDLALTTGYSEVNIRNRGGFKRLVEMGLIKKAEKGKYKSAL